MGVSRGETTDPLLATTACHYSLPLQLATTAKYSKVVASRSGSSAVGSSSAACHPGAGAPARVRSTALGAACASASAHLS